MTAVNVLVVGDANPDLLLVGDTVPRFGQAEQLLDSADLVLGGSAAIVASGLARLGVSTALVAVVGGDQFGRFVLDRLNERGVDTSAVVVAPDRPTGLSVVLSRPDDRSILTLPGTIPALGVDTVREAVERLRPRHVHVASFFLQPELSADLPGLLGWLAARGITVSLDTNWDPAENWGGLAEVLPNVSVLLPNVEEALAIAGALEGRSITGLDEAGAAISARGCRVVVKAGPDGGVAFEGGARTSHAPGLVLDAVDTTGAGDSFDAGFLAAMMRGVESEDERLRWATVAGSLSVRGRGGTLSQATEDELAGHVGIVPSTGGAHSGTSLPAEVEHPDATRDAAPLRVAVIGVGMRGELAGWVDRPGSGAHLVAAVDVNPQARSRALELFGEGVEFLTDHRALSRASVDAAIVVTPDDAHAAVAIDLMRAGIAVYLEKPIAISPTDADEILHVARETGSRLYIGHNMRHMAVVRLMRDIIARGEIGEVKAVWCRHFVGNGGDYYFKDWHADRRRSTGLLLQKGAHDIDVIHWLAGSYARDVVGMGDLGLYGGISDREDRSSQLMDDWFSLDNWPPLSQRGLNPVVDVEDTSMMLMRLESGVLASYEQCHYTPDYWRNYTVIGTEGRLENFGDGDGGVVRVWNTRTTFDPDGDRSYPVTADAAGHGDADQLTVQEFIDFVRLDAPTDTSPVGARYAVAAAVAATQSLRDGSRPRVVEALDSDLELYFRRNQPRPPQPAPSARRWRR